MPTSPAEGFSFLAVSQMKFPLLPPFPFSDRGGPAPLLSRLLPGSLISGKCQPPNLLDLLLATNWELGADPLLNSFFFFFPLLNSRLKSVSLSHSNQSQPKAALSPVRAGCGQTLTEWLPSAKGCSVPRK